MSDFLKLDQVMLNDFLPLDDADRLISHLTGEPLSVGKARRMAKEGKLKICFAHDGFIGLFPVTKEEPTAYTETSQRVRFDGHLQSVVRPRLDAKTIQNDEHGETTFLADYLRPVAVTVPQDEAHPNFNGPGMFLGRIRKRIEHSVIVGKYLDMSPIPNDQWRISSNAIRAIFQKPLPSPTTTTVAASRKKWTPRKLAELAAYREAHTMPETAKEFEISQQLIRRMLPREKPKATPFSGLTRNIR